MIPGIPTDLITEAELTAALANRVVNTDPRLSDARTPTAHNHDAAAIVSGTLAIARIPTGTTSGAVCIGNDARLSDARAPLAHTHGNIGNTGTIGSTANLPLITGASGVIQTGSFGTTVNTFCQGNDSRLSDAREWTASTITQAEAEAGTATTRRAWTSQRVRQAITGWWNSITNVIKSFNTNITGDINRFLVEPPIDATDYAKFDFSTHSGISGENFGNAFIYCNPEEGFKAYTKNGQSTLEAYGTTFSVDPTSIRYVVSHPKEFRQAISAVGSFETNITGGVSSFQVFEPSTNEEEASFYFASHSGPNGNNYGSVLLYASPEEGVGMQARTNVVGAKIYSFRAIATGYDVSEPAAFRQAIKAPSQDEAMYYAIALGGI